MGGAPVVAEAGDHLAVVLMHEGEELLVAPLQSAADAELVADTFRIKLALDAGEDPASVALENPLAEDKRPRADLLEGPGCELRQISLPELAAQLRKCADEATRTIGGYLVHVAAAGGHTAALCGMLAAAPATAAAANRSGTALTLAARYGRDAAVRLLCKAAPAAAKVLDVNDWTPLSWAAARGNAGAVRELLSAMGPEAEVDGCLEAALYHAAEAGHGEVVQLLAEASPSAVSARVQPRDRTAVHAAAESGRVGVLRWLLAAEPAAAMVPDRQGAVPLAVAARVGHAAAVRELLRAAPEALAAKDPSSRSPLQLALLYGRLEAARCLVAAVTARQALDAIGTTPSQRAQPLLPDVIISHAPLAAEDWHRIAAPCPGLGRALPAVLQRAPEQAGEVLRRLGEGATERLRTFALCLARVQRDLDLPLPPHVLQAILAQFDA